ncbi:ferric anguibactin-binding protein [Terasakiispira papahanaumokuakeensis]|uniref:Ferric anguibactin-binding protein n=1 Tax=Terasakiispira papahanaumokuakeensis TaxID=197479 RepID=A0A1E2V5K1_9GAMM|nr:siderophore ABC transporter substrate-binding protein [Terasakiispira papahanaumokuakeensis]ODC02268.1 ferric anguibactin-binding protein [Terasakiispira papahanaumokuakeensis]
MKWSKHIRTFGLLTLAVVLSLPGCQQSAEDQAVTTSESLDTPIVIQHQLGTTTLTQRPHRVAVLDMNEADFLDQLNVPIAGMTKDYVPHFLEGYKTDEAVKDLGAITQPNLERIYTLKPDLILMTSLQANHYDALSEIAPTLHFDINYRDSESGHIQAVKQHLQDLGHIFNKEALAQQKIAELEAKVAQARHITEGRPEKALIVMHNNGAFSSFGVQSRYGFVFEALGVQPASTDEESSLHGQPITSEFIHQANPDIIYIIDRTAVMERRPVITSTQISNPLLRQTRAWKHGHVVFVDADAWYITAASLTSLNIVIDEVISGYQH